MNYEPNTTVWKKGDFVLHDADAKRQNMLMRVVRIFKDGSVQTEYVEEMKRARWGRGTKSRLVNGLNQLHDPARFGVQTPNGSEAK